MVKFSLATKRYTYIQDCKWPLEVIDTHHVILRRSRGKSFFSFLIAIIILGNFLSLSLLQDKLHAVAIGSFLLSGFLLTLLLWKPVKKESVIIMPAFGVQLETHYLSGRIIRRFVPIDNILKPVLLECVTPITCYWSLSLIVRGQEELMLVFKFVHR
ncbi:uncharacterized protein LOC110822439 isoform X2 [Carica papaya]|uniref:uncharacterized protein LOC110822439 isoform X2 n=1 Tax=Carica papaya TaxID=3649 RepID=UPI000B8C8891|nr:uncharacterized protein LOC110822439 isoform X2 [Carica papaya]